MSFSFTRSATSLRNPTIVVVGAGLAGLTAAYRLLKEGMDVHVYEARNRVGGRVFTVDVAGHMAELGAQNITDGGEAIHLHRLIDELDLELTGSKVNLNHSYYNGESLIPVKQILSNKQLDPHILRKQIHELASKSHSMKEILDGIIQQNDPLYKIIAVRLAAYEGASIEKLSTFYAETLFHMLLGGICSVHQGTKEEENYANLLSIKGGNALLPEKMAKVLGDRLHLNMPLTQVSRSGDNSFTLTFYNGQKVETDLLILAIPCSVYNNIIIEENVIPLDRLEAIKSVQYGTNAKILVPFSKTPSKRIGLVNDRIVSFFDVSGSILTVYYTGEASFFSDNTIAHTYTQARAMIEMGFGDACPPFITPLFAKDQAFSTYNAPVGYSWPNDPYAKGSYSYISPGQETLLTAMGHEKGEKFKKLFAPIEQRLYFAGEHASILMEVPGTMEAACESGERAARMILKGARIF